MFHGAVHSVKNASGCSQPPLYLIWIWFLVNLSSRFFKNFSTQWLWLLKNPLQSQSGARELCVLDHYAKSLHMLHKREVTPRLVRLGLSVTRGGAGGGTVGTGGDNNPPYGSSSSIGLFCILVRSTLKCSSTTKTQPRCPMSCPSSHPSSLMAIRPLRKVRSCSLTPPNPRWLTYVGPPDFQCPTVGVAIVLHGSPTQSCTLTLP